jgi:hypothetical protein
MPLSGAACRKGRGQRAIKLAPSPSLETICRVYSMSSQGRLRNIGLATQIYLLAGNLSKGRL